MSVERPWALSWTGGFAATCNARGDIVSLPSTLWTVLVLGISRRRVTTRVAAARDLDKIERELLFLEV
jgi:hypothetical protein